MVVKETEKIIVTVETPDFCIPFDLTHILAKKENLRYANITQEEIERVEPSFFKIKPTWYPELGVARPEHTTAGSMGWNVPTVDGGAISVQLILYYDANEEKDHYEGLRHFNIGGRIVDKCGQEHLIRELKGIKHTLPDYPWIKLTMKPGPEGEPISIKLDRPK